MAQPAIELMPEAAQPEGADGGHAGSSASDGMSEYDESDLEQEAAAARDGEGAPGAGGRGCQHYRRGCKLVGPCCGEAFWCRFCHDAAKDGPSASVPPHKLDRHAVREVECGVCGLTQPVAQTCVNPACGNSFGNYFCRVCNFFDDDLSKEPFHCDGCGICRVGGRNNFFHCDTCGCCYAVELRNNHRCIQGSMHQNCPVCQENLFNSTSECRVLRCGHTMHRDCLRALVNKSHLARCPLCAVSITESAGTWAQMDAEIARSPMPEEYRNKQEAVLCNDCHATSSTAFHVLGLKCISCGSYNTRKRYMCSEAVLCRVSKPLCLHEVLHELSLHEVLHELSRGNALPQY